MPDEMYDAMYEDEWEDEWEDEFEDEYEDEWEDELEDGMDDLEFEAFGGGLIAESGLLEALAEGAAQAETEAEADEFLGAITGLIGKALPSLVKGLPAIAQGLGGLLGGGRRRRRGRGRRRAGGGQAGLARILPLIVRRTSRTVSAAMQRGQRVRSAQVNRILRSHAKQIMSNRRLALRAMRRTRNVSQQYHARQAGGMGSGLGLGF